MDQNKHDMWFTPMRDFWSDETGSQYITGSHYTVRYQEMAELVEQWVVEGKVQLVDAGRSSVSGKGE